MIGPHAESGDLPFWERPETVERFAGRDPDHRLREILTEYAEPSSVHVLDLGCAGGRNSVLLAELGFDLLALDSSLAMVAETKRRVAEVVPPDEAGERVRVARMDELDLVSDSWADLVVALGVHHLAESRAEWDRALDEAVRVLAPGGRLLVAVHTDEADLDGTGLEPVEGEPHVYLRRGRPHYLVDAETLDREWAARGLSPIVPTEVVRKEMDGGGRRVTANAFYRRP